MFAVFIHVTQEMLVNYATQLLDMHAHRRRLHQGGGIFAPVLSKVPGQEYHLPRYYLGVVITLLTVYLLPY